MAVPDVTIGSKRSKLTPATIYSVANSLSNLHIDSSALHIDLSSKFTQTTSTKLHNPLTTLTEEEHRAFLVVLLNKLLISNANIRPQLPLLIQKTLNSDTKTPTFLGTLTEDEFRLLDASSAASLGICAMLDCCASALVPLSDAVAALSCEVCGVDAQVVFMEDEFEVKDEADVACDMKILLSGSSKVVSGVAKARSFAEVPAVHGSFRKAVRDLHGITRVELNTAVRAHNKSFGTDKALMVWVAPLEMAVKWMTENSLERVMLSFGTIADEDTRSKALEVFKKGYKNSLDTGETGSDYVGMFHSCYELIVKYRKLLAWEAAVDLFALQLEDDREKMLGKGTSLTRQILKERLADKNEVCEYNPENLAVWASNMEAYFDPKDAGHDALLSKLKEIVKRLPKRPKNTRDFGGEQMAIRDRAFSIVTNVFKMHGAVCLDTPAFELRETLMGKYWDDSMLIFDIADQGGELYTMRFNLTVPFARYMVMNNITSIKNYQIDKVFRRENKGQYDEFYQCNFDVAGQYEPMEADFEVIKVLTELLDGLEIGDYEIKLNHRKLLDRMLEICGVSAENYRTVCSTIEKLDQQSFEQVKKELVDVKGLSNKVAELILSFVKIRGRPFEVLAELKTVGSKFLENNDSFVTLRELEILFLSLEKSKCLDKVVFDLGLARGLNYYTGVIFEAVLKGSIQAGSIAVGGRYDRLIGLFTGKQVPAVGLSLDIDRAFSIMQQLEKEKDQVIRTAETQVLVAVLLKDAPLAAELVSELCLANIKAEFGLNKNVEAQLDLAEQCGIPWAVIIGDSELNKGVVKIKNVENNLEETIRREDMVEVLKKKLDME